MMAVVPTVDKCPAKYDPYRPVDSSLHRQIAIDDLREEPVMAEQALGQLREWIAKNPAIHACRTDARFLLRFLRVRKFAYVASCETLERNLAMRQRFPEWFSHLDTSEPWVQEMIDSEFILPLGRDELGRSVILYRWANFDTERFTVAQQIRFVQMILECLFEDERNQIAGTVTISDHSNEPMKTFAQWSFTDIKNYIDCVNKSIPVRVREVHVVNMPMFASTVVEWIMSCCSEKLRSRLKCYASLEAFISTTNFKSMLPKEYGGEQEVSEMKRELRQMLDQHREVLLALDDMKIDEKRCTSIWNQNQRTDLESGAIGSFRKLNVD
ncbi:clavesin-2-like [Anopheles albimanus]|uniref:clavesin-2-like n=1 Tax=Anopheles albimanus TaxID=7167 RepID=UPI0016416239|nr:clavesin-2-like [Anopheles albimanus]